MTSDYYYFLQECPGMTPNNKAQATLYGNANYWNWLEFATVLQY